MPALGLVSLLIAFALGVWFFFGANTQTASDNEPAGSTTYEESINAAQEAADLLGN